MQMARVVGTVVATQKDPKLVGFKLQVVQPLQIASGEPAGSCIVAVDTVGAGVGDIVMTVSGSSARQAAKLSHSPVDAAVVGIIDAVHLGTTEVYSRRQEGKWRPCGSEE